MAAELPYADWQKDRYDEAYSRLSQFLRTRLKTRIFLSVATIMKDVPSIETVLHIVALHGRFELRLQWKSMSCGIWMVKGIDCIYLQREAKLGTYVNLWLSTYNLFRNY